jgi:hypothetical protein
MSSHLRVVWCTAAAIAVGAAGAGAQSAAGKLVDTTRVDTAAVNALERMGTYLRSLNAFQVKAATTTEKVLDDGQKIQQSQTADLVAHKPNQLRVEFMNERNPRTLFYDGKTFTLWAPRPKYYATTAAPPTIAQLIDTLDDRFDIQMPFVDLFRWGTPESNIGDLTAALYVGPSVINGVTCDHYAYRQPGVDWQVWIQSGDYPLPHKLVITTTTDDARPQHESVYSWNLAPSFTDASFAFEAPVDAKKITFKDAAAVRDSLKKKGGDRK